MLVAREIFSFVILSYSCTFIICYYSIILYTSRKKLARKRNFDKIIVINIWYMILNRVVQTSGHVCRID